MPWEANGGRTQARARDARSRSPGGRGRAVVLTNLCVVSPRLPFTKWGHAHLIQERTTMTTILIINAASSLLATFGIGGFLVRKHRQASRQPPRAAGVCDHRNDSPPAARLRPADCGTLAVVNICAGGTAVRTATRTARRPPAARRAETPGSMSVVRRTACRQTTRPRSKEPAPRRVRRAAAGGAAGHPAATRARADVHHRGALVAAADHERDDAARGFRRDEALGQFVARTAKIREAQAADHAIKARLDRCRCSRSAPWAR